MQANIDIRTSQTVNFSKKSIFAEIFEFKIFQKPKIDNVKIIF